MRIIAAQKLLFLKLTTIPVVIAMPPVGTVRLKESPVLMEGFIIL